MEFSLTEEQQVMYDQLKRFAEKEIAPSAAERDERQEFDRGIWKQMAEIGILGMPFPEEYGGQGMSCLDTCRASAIIFTGARLVPRLIINEQLQRQVRRIL